MTTEIKRLPRSLRLGGTPLYKAPPSGELPQPDGVRRVSKQCIELETYANFTQSSIAGHIGMSILVTASALLLILAVADRDKITEQTLLTFALIAPVLPSIVLFFYFTSGAHRSRGGYIRIHRETRKAYFIYPRQTHLHVLDWDSIEALAGYIPTFTGSINTSRHPLYLIGIDYAMDPPAEICAACGNLGMFDGDRSARALWSYLQAFMERGPEGLPKPAPLQPRRSRWQETQQPYRDWYTGLRGRLAKPYGLLKAPITIPLWLGWLLINAFPDSVEAFIQYNVPYTQFPKEIDRLCGFDEKRTPVIRVNGERIEP